MIEHRPAVPRARPPLPRSLRALAAALLALLPACVEPVPVPTEGVAAAGRPFVRGYLFATVGGGSQQGGERIFLPGATVTLREHNAAVPWGTVRTDLSGRFSFSPVPAGVYRLCWSHPGVAPACAPGDVTVASRGVLTGPLQASLAPAPGTRPVYGSVRAVKGAVRTLEPMFGVNAYARVAVVDGAGTVLDSAYVNNYGDYLLTQAPARGTASVVATLEGSTARRALSSGTDHARVDLQFRNSAPRVELIQTVGGARVQNAPAGTVVDVEARAFDPDGDPVRFLWYTPDASGSGAERVGDRRARWKLATGGGNRLYVLASDGKGGYTRLTTTVATTPRARFAGRVLDSGTGTVAGAEVEVNGVRAATAATGRFVVDVPFTGRYVVNVRKPGYNLVSRVYTEPVGDGTWVLTRGTVVTANPDSVIEVVDTREFQRCGDPLAGREQRPRPRMDSVLLARYQDGAGTVTRVGGRVPRPYPTGGCGPGARLQIPAGALVDSAGNAPAGPVEVTLFTVDPRAPFDMPGDYTVVDSAGGERAMQTYGAAVVEVTGGGREYNLRPGAEALISIPIDPAQLAAPGPEPDSIPLLVYDEAKGVWRPEGVLVRDGAAYVARVRHFSAFNADLLFVNPACVQIYSPTLPPLYNLEVTVPQTGGAAPRVFTLLVDNSTPYHVVYNLPTGVDIVMVPYSTVNVPFGTFIINTGGAQNPLTPNPPDPPYNACDNLAELEDVAEPEPGTDAFLHGLYSFAASNLTELEPGTDPVALNAATTAYYNQVDPQGLRETLTEFQTQNGFPTNEIHAVYANSADLGFGRDMHCRKFPASDSQDDVACYVTNYGFEPTPDGLDFVNAATNNGPGATVAMEWSRIEVGTGFTPYRVVKFYVFAAGGASRLLSIDLDGYGERPIPQLCVVCHGGDVPGGTSPAFPDAASVNMGSVFIPFDLSGFTILDGVVPALDKINQQLAFRRLNEEIVLATQPGAANAEIIAAMYPTLSPVQDETFVIAGWNGDAANQTFYREVLGPSCRTCHASRPVGAINFRLATDFTNYGTYTRDLVCTDRVMPHALRTYNRFWGSVSPHQPAQFKAFGDAKVAGGFGPECITPP